MDGHPYNQQRLNQMHQSGPTCSGIWVGSIGSSLLEVRIAKLEAALDALTKQIEMGDFRDVVGHPLKNNAHHLAAKDVATAAPEKPKPREPSFRFPPRKR